MTTHDIVRPEELAPAAPERITALNEARRHFTVNAVFGPVMLGAAGVIAWRTASVLRVGEIAVEPAIVHRSHDPVIFYGMAAVLAGCCLAFAGMGARLLRDAFHARARIARLSREP